MFKIHNDAKNWASNLVRSGSPIKTQFDVYYLSFIVGIGLGRSHNFKSASVTEITRNVTEPFIPYRYVLTGLLLVSELTNAGLVINKNLVKNKVSELLNSHSQSLLSDEAIEIMNCFAYGGFEAMREKLPKAPQPHDPPA